MNQPAINVHICFATEQRVLTADKTLWPLLIVKVLVRVNRAFVGWGIVDNHDHRGVTRLALQSRVSAGAIYGGHLFKD